jgi:ribosomal protein S18 acetylase RimI-like enzyme
MPDIEIGKLRRDELPAAGALLGRAYRDNPWMIALLGDDPRERYRVLETMQGLRIAPLEPPSLVARRSGILVGVCGFDAPVRASPSPEDMKVFFDVAAGVSPGIIPRLQEMLVEFDRRAPKEPHWHLGPVGVDVDAQRQGIGGRMLERFCQILDAKGDICSLETEEWDNVRLYERFGWVTVEEAPVLGVPGWFMIRRPRA